MRRNALRLSRPTALNSSAAIRATERRCRKKLRQYCSCHLHRAISFYRDGAGENTSLPRYNLNVVVFARLLDLKLDSDDFIEAFDDMRKLLRCRAA